MTRLIARPSPHRTESTSSRSFFLLAIGGHIIARTVTHGSYRAFNRGGPSKNIRSRHRSDRRRSPEIQRNGTNVRLPASFDIPAFPRHLQTKLDNKEPCQRNPKDRHIMIWVLYEAVALYTMYPTTSEYVQVVKMLIAKYPFLKDLEGNGYHTWHMSLRRKFKWERAPLVDNSEVRGSKEKFGHKKSKQLVETVRTSQRNVSKETKEPSQLSQYPDSPDPVFPTSFLPQTDLSENTVTEEIFSASYLNAVPQSTPVKQHRIHSSKQEPDYTLPSSLLLVLSSPATAVKSSKPSTSGTYYAFPAAKSYQFCEKTDAENDNLSEGLSLDVSMLSLNPPSEKKDTSFVPPSSTSTSTPTTEDDEENRLKDRKWIVNESSLMELFNRCHYCGASVIETQKTTCGSLIRVKWECCNGHHGKWDSCDDIRGMPANNLLVAACTLFTGATYVDIDDWATLLNLQLPKKTTFYAIQSSYLIPVIDVMYKEQQENILEGLRMQNILEKGVHLSGDGRNDSPGFSAKYCTYSLMDDLTNQVVHYELVQVTEASSSVGMEPVGFKRGVNSLLEMGMDIEVMTTDRSPSIRKIMRVDYPQIHHEFDIWHVVKGFFKKLLSVSKKKENIDLQPWIKSICNHLWYACASCSGDPDVLIEKWKSLLHHICGEHQWEENGRQQRCAHDDLTPDQQKRKRWLRKESPAFHTLTSLVLHQNLLKDMRQMALFKHTGGLEVYHSVLLKYCRKNLHFHYSSMTARTQLAIMDHNENVNRQQDTTSSGIPRYNVVFSKQNKEWVARKIYEPTSQKFRDELLQKVLDRRNDPTVLFKDPTSQVSLPVLPCNIATKQKPEKDAVIAKHASRFSN